MTTSLLELFIAAKNSSAKIVRISTFGLQKNHDFAGAGAWLGLSLTKNFQTQNFLGSEIFFGPKILIESKLFSDPKFSSDKHFFADTIFLLDLHFFGPKI